MPSRIERIEVIREFEQDAKSLKKKHRNLRLMLEPIRAIVEGDKDKLAGYDDHGITGDWSGYRELHVQGDWLLVYFIDDGGLVLVLTRTASHDELYAAKTSRKLIKGYRTAPRRPFNA